MKSKKQKREEAINRARNAYPVKYPNGSRRFPTLQDYLQHFGFKGVSEEAPTMISE